MGSMQRLRLRMDYERVSKDLLSSIIYSSSAFLVWKDLKVRFYKVNRSIIYQLHREISIMQKGLDSIQIYFGKLKLLCDEFKAICDLSICGCDELKVHIAHQNNIKLFQVCTGLNDTYNNVISNMLMRLPLPTLNEAYSVLIQEESQRGITTSISLTNNGINTNLNT